MLQPCPIADGALPTSSFPIAANDSQQPRSFVSSNQTHQVLSGFKFGEGQAKKAAEDKGGIEVNSSRRTGALFQLTQYICLTTV